MIEVFGGPTLPNIVDEARLIALKKLVGPFTANTVFMTAFDSRESFVVYADQIAWESHVWIADNPEHMIHFNGDKFLGPYAKTKK